ADHGGLSGYTGVYRYLALIWHPGNVGAAAAARDAREQCDRLLRNWTCVLDRDGLVVFHTGADAREGACETRVLHGDAGVICGRAFQLDDELRPHECGAPIEEATTGQIVATRGKALIEHYWGR